MSTKSKMRRFSPVMVLLILAAFAAAPAREGSPSLGALVEITPDDGFFMAPAFSPDGSSVIAAGRKYGGIYAFNPDGSGARVITDEPGAGFRPSFSPDGRLLAFLSRKVETGSISGAVNIADLRSGDIVQLTSYAWMRGLPVFYSDNEILFTVDRRLVKLNVETLIEEVVFEDVRSFGFDAKPGGPIVLDERGYVSLADLSAKAQRVLLSGSGVFLPLISPARDLVAVRESRATEGHVWVCSLDGKHRIDTGLGYSPAWSPDGRWIVFEINENDGERFTSGDLWIMKLDGSERIRLTFSDDVVEVDPAFSPDGKTLVFGEANTGRLFAAEVAWPER